MKNLIFLSSLIFLITACSKKDENISIEKNIHKIVLNQNMKKRF
ncbi:hypothetical protein [Aliarcobacter cryaerophilus]|nr:hypothetical protein [Aliarcobacter cryaerophilus]